MLAPYPISFNYRDEQLARLRAHEVHQAHATLEITGPDQWREIIRDFLSEAQQFRFAPQTFSKWAFNLQAKADYIEPQPHGPTTYWPSAVLRYMWDTYEQGDKNDRLKFLLDLTSEWPWKVILRTIRLLLGEECPLQEEITRDAAKLAREIEEAGPSQADGTHNWQQDLQRMRDTSDESLLCLGWIHQIENAFEHFTTSAASPREASIAAHWTLRYLWNDFVQKRDAAQRGRGPYVAREVSEETMLDFMTDIPWMVVIEACKEVRIHNRLGEARVPPPRPAQGAPRPRTITGPPPAFYPRRQDQPRSEHLLGRMSFRQRQIYGRGGSGL